MFYKTVSDSFSWLEIAPSLLTVVSLPPGQVLAAVGSGDRADCAITGKGALHGGEGCTLATPAVTLFFCCKCFSNQTAHCGDRFTVEQGSSSWLGHGGTK